MVFLLTFPLKTDILTHFGPKNRGLGAIELWNIAFATCKVYWYITTIITTLIIPSLPCFSGVFVDLWPEKGYFDPFWAQKGGFEGIKFWNGNAFSYTASQFVANIYGIHFIPSLQFFCGVSVALCARMLFSPFLGQFWDCPFLTLNFNDFEKISFYHIDQINYLSKEEKSKSKPLIVLDL